jgi:hypothetical protein
MTQFFCFFLFIMACQVSSRQGKNSEVDNNCTFSIDSLKWKMYSLTYDVKLKKLVDEGTHFEKKDDSIFNVIECDIEISGIKEKGDTVQYFLNFRRNNFSDKYVQVLADSYVGIGYVKKLCVYYPIPGKSYFDVELNFYNDFFQKQEEGFIKYLRQYKGNFCNWVKQTAIKKNIIN